jgi:hypothetical protein
LSAFDGPVELNQVVTGLETACLRSPLAMTPAQQEKRRAMLFSDLRRRREEKAQASTKRC